MAKLKNKRKYGIADCGVTTPANSFQAMLDIGPGIFLFQCLKVTGGNESLVHLFKAWAANQFEERFLADQEDLNQRLVVQLEVG